MIDLQLKDLKLVLEAAGQAGVKLETVSYVTELFGKLRSQGRGRDGTQALFEIVKSTSV
jgi:3-hydroxyisobutyrate dehydrogenase-like beta-hydroxyacid dehydrogenase